MRHGRDGAGRGMSCPTGNAVSGVGDGAVPAMH